MVNHKKEVTKENICKYLHLPISKAAEALNISTSVLKKRCRSFGISNWPYRKIRSVDKKINRLRKVLETNPEYGPEINSEIARYMSKRERVIEHPELVKLSAHVNVSRIQKQSSPVKVSSFDNLRTITSPTSVAPAKNPGSEVSLPSMENLLLRVQSFPQLTSIPPLPATVVNNLFVQGQQIQQQQQQQQQQRIQQNQNQTSSSSSSTLQLNGEVVDDSPKFNLPPLEGIASVLCSLSTICQKSDNDNAQSNDGNTENGNVNNNSNSDGNNENGNENEVDEKPFLPPCSSFDLAPPLVSLKI